MNETNQVPSAESTAIEIQESNLDRQLEWIRAVDAKVPTVIGIATTMLAVTGALSPQPENLSWESGLWMALASIPLLVCLVFCAAATFPKTKGPAGSLIYFGGICERSHSEYSNAVSQRSDSEYLDDLNQQCHRNAELAKAKYAALQWAMRCLFVGTAFWLVGCYMLYKG